MVTRMLDKDARTRPEIDEVLEKLHASLIRKQKSIDTKDTNIKTQSLEYFEEGPQNEQTLLQECNAMYQSLMKEKISPSDCRMAKLEFIRVSQMVLKELS